MHQRMWNILSFDSKRTFISLLKQSEKHIKDAQLFILVDEARDVAKKEHMNLVLRFVDWDRLIREIFLDLVHVKDSSSKNLQNEISRVLSHHALDIQKLRGLRYDGASNMQANRMVYNIYFSMSSHMLITFIVWLKDYN